MHTYLLGLLMKLLVQSKLPVQRDSSDMPACVTSEWATQTPAEDILRHLQVDHGSGLSSEEAASRRKLVGANEFIEEDEEPMWQKYLGQFKDPMIALLLASAAISVLMGQYDDALSITVAIVIVVTVAFIQEYRSEQSLNELKKLLPPHCQCYRDAVLQDFEARLLVPGDIISLTVGDRVPADVRLLETVDFQVDESSFTGETEPARKLASTVQSSDAHTVSNRTNMVFMGTLTCSGHAKGVVTATGTYTEFGEVFKLMQKEEAPRTPLQKSMGRLSKQLAFISLGVIGVILFIGWVVERRHLLEMFTIAVSLAVAAIPEGLPIVVTVTLALGSIRVSKRNAIVKKLPTVESLGCANVICSDKTGTLTENVMTVTDIYTASGELYKVAGNGYSAEGDVTLNGECVQVSNQHALHRLVEAGCVCSNASVTNGTLVGQATEGAIVTVAYKLGLNNPRDDYIRLEEIPFSSDKKWMAVACQSKQGVQGQAEVQYFVKGSVESVLTRCQQYQSLAAGSRTEAVLAADRERFLNSENQLASRGLRVLAVATGPSMKQLVFLGLIAMHDPPRLGVPKAIRSLRSGGVAVKMVTGDSKATAIAIGHLLDMSGEAMSGDELEMLTTSVADQSLLQRIRVSDIFYRVSPRHKVLIVKALQDQGNIVAMTGDGVNDAVALKTADIGVAMGKTGTDVSKEAADVILVNDDFGTILAAIEEGKSIFYNIKNFVRFQLSTSIAALSLIAISTLFSLPSPLNAMQILWINIIMDGPPAQSLGVEPVDRDVTRRPPRKISQGMITPLLAARVVMSALCIVLGTFWIFWREMSIDNKVTARDTTMTFTCFVFFDMFNALSSRSEFKSVLQLGLFSNRAFVIAVGGSLIGQMLVVYFPPLQRVFITEALGAHDLLLLVALSSTVLICDEVLKLYRRHYGLVNSYQPVENMPVTRM
ncbi:calcium-transporting ATPase type 2C member 1-like [Sycon ciliatum]|uniref:calcium-transporting ATPase type 2C member 1-like n=1 Tax=Sycon ciliatum TaxID=27933 RepID=UPI0031F71251